MNCNICKTNDISLIYESVGGSISSICELSENDISVYLCNCCSHVFTDFKIDYSEYYDESYNILTQSEDEDQLYEIIDNTKIFRTEHQVNLLMKDLKLNIETQILDFGCAKSSTMKILSSKLGIHPHLFDISERYLPFWDQFVDEKNYATYEIPKSWENKFSIVTSFFSLEHISDPVDTIKTIYKVLQEEGQLYFIVPNFLVNIADLIVNEHINHFTTGSITYLLQTHDFEIESIDTESYFGAIVVRARKSANRSKNSQEKYNKIKVEEKIREVSDYWSTFDKRIIEIENKIASHKFSIYGSGFYGSLVFSKLRKKDNLKYFIDQSPYRQNTKLFNHSIVGFHDIEDDMKNIIVGLNPKNSKKIVMDLKMSNDINFYYL